ncbi:unnamed protein product [Linum tenue]|uniref:H15 domain-containing protein n=1 Tax=Linum tenue TaxID=586396 RepID=A0AAV0Q7H6_9ROSI|nr:unnamed protein product [Linum tenue]
MDPLHNHIPPLPWDQPTPTATVAAAPYPVVTFPHAAGLQPHSYVPQQSFPNFAPPAGATALPTDPSPASAPAPTPTPTAAAAQAPGGLPSSLPSYSKMIFTAIEALKERDGSSKRAISKYIDHAYHGLLPPNYGDLLANQLKLLKSKGLLDMVKKSYKISGSGGVTANINDLPDLTLDSSLQPPPPTQGPLSPPSVGPKRGRGRPPKAKPTTAPQPTVETLLPNGQVAQPVSDSLPPGFVANGQPATGHYPSSGVDVNVNVEEGVHGATQPVTVPVGLAAEDGTATATAKRRPGRPPKKPLGVDTSGVGIVKRGRGRPPKSVLGLGTKKRSPGRPRKPKPKTVAAVSGAKRRPGRPPKNQANSVAVPYASIEAAAPLSVPRPRGRPRKGTGSIAAGVGVGVLGLNDGVLEPRRSGRPVGHPKKYTDESDALGEAEFRRKLVFFQSRVKDVAGVLRPMLSNDAPEKVVKAVAELEKLAKIDIEQELKEEIVSFNLHDLDLDAEAAVGES